MADHIVHRHRQGSVITEHRHAQAVPDKDHFDPGLFLKIGGRVIIAGQPGDRNTIRNFLEQCWQSVFLSFDHYCLSHYLPRGV